MNDDLSVLITYLDKAHGMKQIAVGIIHGMNIPEIKDFEFYREDDVVKAYMNILPEQISKDIELILKIEEINETILVK